MADSLEPNRDLFVQFTAPFRYRNHDSSYRFRPDSSFYYLTGFAEPESILFIWREKSGAKTLTHSHLFVQPRDLAREQWDGFRYGVERARALTDVNFADSSSDFSQKLLQWLGEVPAPGKAPRVYSNAGIYPEWKIQLERSLEQFRPAHRSGKKPVEALIDGTPLVGAQRLIKDSGELDVMRKSSKINVKAHLRVMHELQPGMYEYEIQGIVESEYQKNGCPDPAYTSICAGGANATILHYIENSKRLKEGELFLIDAGCEYNFFASDITRTLPIGGTYSAHQRIIMDIVAEAHAETLLQARVGVEFSKLHETAEDVLIEGLRKLKIIKGSKKEIRESKSYKRYYPHGTSHWLGHDVHDACPYIDSKGESLRLQPGMVFTIEPGLYFMKDDKSVSEEWRGIGVRIEDDVLVTKNKPEVFTNGLPRYAAEIEREMRSARSKKA